MRLTRISSANDLKLLQAGKAYLERRSVVALLAMASVGIVSLVTTTSGNAQTFPSRQMSIVLPFPPGATSDTLARFIADKLSKKFGKQVIVENRAGGATVPATSVVVQSQPDGHMLLQSGTQTNINPFMGVKTPYDVDRDLTPVALLVANPGVLVVHSSVPAKNIAELIALAKSAPQPILYSSPGVGSFNHLAVEQLIQKSGMQLQHVPFRGLSAAVMGVVRNDAQIFMSDIPTALEHIKTGSIRAIAQSGRTRMPQFPDLPTLAEAGVAGYEAAGFQAVWARAGTPPDVIKVLNAEINEAMASPEVRQYVETQGLQPLGGTTEQFAAHMKRDKEIWQPVIEKAGIKMEQ